jgi:hypothetical protein
MLAAATSCGEIVSRQFRQYPAVNQVVAESPLVMWILVTATACALVI